MSPALRPPRDPGSLVTYRFREYDLSWRSDVNQLAADLGITDQVLAMRQTGSGCVPDDIARLLWLTVLARRAR